MTVHQKITTRGWLAFEQNVLHRLHLETAAFPLCPDPGLGIYLKGRGVKVSVNDPLQSNWVSGISRLQNGTETMSADDVATVLDDAYVPGYKLSNPALANWFTETDAWWFDNVRKNIEKLASPFSRSIAGQLAIATGDYARSFSGPDRALRQPLSHAFRRFWSIEPSPVAGTAVCSNKPVDEYITDHTTMENYSDLHFIRLPRPHSRSTRDSLGDDAWREEWIRGGNDFWDNIDERIAGMLGTATETKTQYLRIVERFLEKAAYAKRWAIAHVESGFISTQDIIDVISPIRRVESIYTKDLSELTGVKAVIIIA